jgi:hypothetical protein
MWLLAWCVEMHPWEIAQAVFQGSTMLEIRERICTDSHPPLLEVHCERVGSCVCCKVQLENLKWGAKGWWEAESRCWQVVPGWIHSEPCRAGARHRWDWENVTRCIKGFWHNRYPELWKKLRTKISHHNLWVMIKPELESQWTETWAFTPYKKESVFFWVHQENTKYKIFTCIWNVHFMYSSTALLISSHPVHQQIFTGIPIMTSGTSFIHFDTAFHS